MSTIQIQSAHDAAALRDTLSARWHELAPALDTVVAEFDTHAHFTRSELHAVEPQGQQLLIHYRVHYHVYHPCRGLDVHDSCLRFIRANFNANGLTLASHQALPERSTADEL